MAERGWLLDAGEQGVVDRLRDEATAIAQQERMLKAAKRRRDTLVAKCVRAGLPERVIADAAGVSGPRINQIKKRAIDGSVSS